MQVNSQGFVKATIYNYLEYMVSDIQANGAFGSDFSIKKEGVLDAILATISNCCLSIEDKLAFAFKQLNPYTAEGEWQDRLYSLVGLIRNYATNTIVTRTIEGEVGTEIGVNELVFRTSQDDQFYLNTPVTIGENGKAVGSFTAYELGAIECDSASNLDIVSAPLGINGVYYTDGNVTNVGDDYEDDSEFRLRWIATNSVRGGNTEGGMYAALLPLADNSTNNLVIHQNRATQKYLDFPLHTMHIIIKSAESNETIANTIFDNLMDGVGLYGEIEVPITDISGTVETISFSRAVSKKIYFRVEIALKSGYIIAQVRDSVGQVIVDNFDYAMGERIIGNDFYRHVNDIEGIDYCFIKVSTDNITFTDIANVDYNEYGTVEFDDIEVVEI